MANQEVTGFINCHYETNENPAGGTSTQDRFFKLKFKGGKTAWEKADDVRKILGDDVMDVMTAHYNEVVSKKSRSHDEQIAAGEAEEGGLYGYQIPNTKMMIPCTVIKRKETDDGEDMEVDSESPFNSATYDLVKLKFHKELLKPKAAKQAEKMLKGASEWHCEFDMCDLSETFMKKFGVKGYEDSPLLEEFFASESEGSSDGSSESEEEVKKKGRNWREAPPMNERGEYLSSLTYHLKMFKAPEINELKENKASKKTVLDLTETVEEFENLLEKSKPFHVRTKNEKKALKEAEKIKKAELAEKKKLQKEEDEMKKKQAAIEAKRNKMSKTTRGSPENAKKRKTTAGTGGELPEAFTETSKPDLKDDTQITRQMKRIKGLLKKIDTKSRTELTAMEYCAGGGGLATGLKNAGFKSLCLLDFVAECTQSLTGNFPKNPVLLGDLKDCVPKKSAFETLDILSAGLPCQSFSKLGKRETFEHEAKGLSLWRGFIGIARVLQPKLVMVENVAPCLRDIQRECPEICQMFDDAGYVLTSKIFDSNHLGVPQNRKRMILLATNKRLNRDRFTFAKFQCYDTTCPKFKDIFKGNPQGEVPLISNKISEDVLPLVPVAGNFSEIDPDLQLKIKESLGVGLRTKDLRRPNPEKPCPTITTQGGAMSGWGCIIHPKEPRALNTIEMGRVQTFPDDHYFGGPLDKHVMQIGNAVPVKMGERLGRMVQEFLYECAAENPKHFKKLGQKEHEWMNEYMGLENRIGRRGTQLDKEQYNGYFWHPAPEGKKLTQQVLMNPDLMEFYEGDRVLVKYVAKEGADAQDIFGTIVRDRITTGAIGKTRGAKKVSARGELFVRFIDPVAKMAVMQRLRSKYKKSDVGVVGVGHPKLGTGLILTDYEIDHRKGETHGRVSQNLGGRVNKKAIPVSRLKKGHTELLDQMKEMNKYHKMETKKPLNECTNEKWFCPIAKDTYHDYPVGTVVEVYRINSQKKKDQHPVECVVVSKGKKELIPGAGLPPKEYIEIKYTDSKAAKTAVAPEFHRLLRGKKQDRLICWVQYTGRMWIMEGIYVKMQPLREHDDEIEWNIDNRPEAMNNCRILLKWDEINMKSYHTWVKRKDVQCHAINRRTAYGDIKYISESNKKLILSPASQPKVGRTMMILSRKAKAEPALIKQITSQTMEVMWADGVCEVLPRSMICMRTLLSSEKGLTIKKSVEKTWQCSCDNMKEEFEIYVDPRGASRDTKIAYPLDRDQEQAEGKLAKQMELKDLVPAPRASYSVFRQNFELEPVQYVKHNFPESDYPKGVDTLTWKQLKTHEQDLDPSKKRKNMKLNQYYEFRTSGPEWKFNETYPAVFGNHGNWFVGQRFDNRGHAYVHGVQRQTMRGISTFDTVIDGTEMTMCDAVCFANGYADDTHDLTMEAVYQPKDVYLYTGEGRESAGDQTWESKGNKGMWNAYEQKWPVRMLVKRLNNPLKQGDGQHYVYGGLYYLTEATMLKSEKTCQLVTRVKLEPYDWKCKAIEKIHKEGLEWKVNRLEGWVKSVKTFEDFMECAKEFCAIVRGQIYRKYPGLVQERVEKLKKQIVKEHGVLMKKKKVAE